MNELLQTIIIIAAFAAAGVIAGNGAVYGFNRIPARWLCAHGEEPSDYVRSEGTQRVKSYPFKYIFTASFIVVGIYMGISDWQYAVAGDLACWLLLLTGIADKKYGIIPDQLVLALAITGFGFIPSAGGVARMLLGVAAGGGAMLLIVLISRLAAGKNVVGFGPVKLCAAAGLITGPYGAAFSVIGGLAACGVYTAFHMLRTGRRMPGEVRETAYDGGERTARGHLDPENQDPAAGRENLRGGLPKKTELFLGMFICAAAAVYIIVVHKYF